jgi:hypothetical protein
MRKQTHIQPHHVELFVPQPKSAEVLYSTCGLIRQDTLMLERKVGTHDWAKRGVNMPLFAMIVVDTCLVHSKSTESKKTQKDYYEDLAEELIDNTYDGAPTAAAGCRRSRENAGVVDPNPTLDDI